MAGGPTSLRDEETVQRPQAEVSALFGKRSAASTKVEEHQERMSRGRRQGLGVLARTLNVPSLTRLSFLLTNVSRSSSENYEVSGIATLKKM